MLTRQALIEQFLEDSRRLSRKFWLAHHSVWRQVKLHPAQAWLLLWLEKQSPIGLKALATAMAISSSAATQALHPLIARRLIKQLHGDKDRRQVAIQLTPRGRAKVQAIRRLYRRQATVLLKPLANGELRTVLRLHQKLLRSS